MCGPSVSPAHVVVVAAARRELVSYWSDGRRVGRAVNARGGASRARKVLVRSSASPGRWTNLLRSREREKRERRGSVASHISAVRARED